ncbi:MAG TPA: hypothetical protein VHT97_11795 [Acidimicrobiales bacterium]|nr:hypothetical protein [Acidimicrobiales bacterium]
MLLLVCFVAMAVAGCARTEPGERVEASDPGKGGQTTATAPPTTQVGPACTESDLRSPGPAAMPTPVRLATVETFPTATVTLSPPAPNDVSSVSPQQAWDNAFTEKRSDARYEVLLARMSAQFPATMGPGTATTPQYQGVLVWAVVAHRIPSSPPGGPPLAAGQTVRPGPACYWGDGLDFTDATTGQRIFSATFGSGT